MTMVCHDVLVAGGGVVGMTTAFALARRGVRVALADRGGFGRESSWAGAGIISPAPPRHAPTAFGRLRAASYGAWPSLAAELTAATGIDIGYRRCGGVHLLSMEELESFLALAAAEGVRAQPCALARTVPAAAATTMAAVEVPALCQVRNPRVLRALAAALEQRGATLLPNTPIAALEQCSEGWRARTAAGAGLRARAVVVAAGAWSSALLEPFAPAAAVRPVRGQLLALQAPAGLLRQVVEVGRRYLVPRDDGVVLVGATEEAAGFDKTVQPAVAATLRAFAASVIPVLADAPELGSWTGLRPATPHGRPWLYSPRPGLWVAAGHYRQGLQLAPGTAWLLADWLCGLPSFATSDDFAPGAPLDATASAFVS